MSWLGLADTQWTMLNESDEAPATDSMTIMYERFMDALPILLGDFAPELKPQKAQASLLCFLWLKNINSGAAAAWESECCR